MTSSELPQRYRFNANPNGAHQLILSAISPGSRVLDVGCGSGYLARHCPSSDVLWYGVDIDAGAVEQARNFYESVCVYNLDDPGSFPYNDIAFDTVVMADVLEHLVDPVSVLSKLVTYIRPGGQAIISVPNVAHFTVRLGLLFGRFNYTDSGILDKSHLHLYTKNTAPQLVRQAGLVVTDIKYSSDRFGPIANKWPVFAGLLAFNVVLFSQKPV